MQPRPTEYLLGTFWTDGGLFHISVVEAVPVYASKQLIVWEIEPEPLLLRSVNLSLYRISMFDVASQLLWKIVFYGGYHLLKPVLAFLYYCCGRM